MYFSKEQLQSIQLLAFDFDGVFTDNTVIVSEDGKESVRCWRSDGLGLSKLKDLNIHLRIISTEKNPVVTRRAKKLEIECIQGVTDKAKALNNLSQDLKIDLKNVMFVGNDMNDIPAFRIVGFPVGVADSHESIIPHIIFTLEKSGGKGAVREICDIIFNAFNE